MKIILQLIFQIHFYKDTLLVFYLILCPTRVISININSILLFKHYNLLRNMVKKPVLIKE